MMFRQRGQQRLRLRSVIVTVYSLSVLLLLLLSSSSCTGVVSAASSDETEYHMGYLPEIHVSARVKQHRSGATGQLVPGEEDLRKIIVTWDKPTNDVVGSIAHYEICHQCGSDQIDGDTGMMKEGATALGEDKLKIVPIGRAGECGGHPCLVFPSCPKGKNTFNLRIAYKIDGANDYKYSLWSPQRVFMVDEPGNISHHHDGEL